MFDDVFYNTQKCLLALPHFYLQAFKLSFLHLTLPAGIVVLAKIFKNPSEDLTCLVQWPTLDCSLSPSAARPQRQPRDFPKIKISMLHLFVSPQDPDM